MARLSGVSNALPQVDDLYLIALAKQGNDYAYDRLVRRYYSFVRLKSSSYFLAGGDADDLIQEGLVGLYKAIRDYGIDGVECFYPTHTREQAELLARRCAELKMLTTGSSDYHGPAHRQFSSFRAFSTHGVEAVLGPIAN